MSAGKEISKVLHIARKVKLKAHYEHAHAEAEKEFKFFKNSAVFVAGLVAYWGSGDKVTQYRCRVTSSEPGLVRVYLVFLKAVCTVPSGKIRATLLLYPGMDEQACVRHWVAMTGLPVDQFGRSVFTKTRPKSRRVSHGVCNVAVSSRYLKEKMIVWLRLLAEEFADMV